MVYSNKREAIDVGIRTLPAGYYTDPNYFARELEKIHFNMWLYAGRKEDVPDAGNFVTRQIGNANVILVRDEQNMIRAHHNVCRHRGTLLCHEPQGRFQGSSIQCRYHGWTYRFDGTLRKATHMEKVSGFCEEDWPLRKVHLAEWDDLIFVSFAENPPPLAQQLGDLIARFKNWRMLELATVERRTYHLQANWKLIIQNYHECLHCPIAHPQLTKITPYMSGENEPPHPSWLGAYMDFNPGFSTLSTLQQSPRKTLPHLTAEEAKHVYYYAILPNMLINFHPDYVVTFMFNPIAADRTDVTCHWLMHKEEIARPGFDPSDAIDFWHLTNQQDWELSDLAQRGISSRGYTPGPYSNREELLIALDRWILERAGTL